ncbi:MAG: thiol-disulfide oxidoreductase DCC family protein [Cytophagales bacterium]|nr:MAG: thiol-disulfide oxidoreductase DCC family protein [Cytophagales bacterium]TAF59641.1 MAG: thiol-disulfide oxidoreductase DCC family protein [Cytophagales bacterium]
MYPKSHILLFDGVCNACNGLVNFIIDHDKQKRIHFASLQSEFGQTLLRQYHFDTQNFSTFIYLRESNLLVKSDAALSLFQDLGGIWRAALLLKIVPAFIRDFFYDIIARNRYKIFGKRDACRMPTPDIQARFL